MHMLIGYLKNSRDKFRIGWSVDTSIKFAAASSNLTDSQYFLAKESRGAGSPAIFPIEWLRALRSGRLEELGK